MKLNNLTAGGHVPHSVNMLVEIAVGGDPVKYEFDKEIGALRVDRFMQTSMRYPCNYGFIPHTLAGDGDPVDVLLYSTYAVIPGSIIEVRPIGVLLTEDEKGEDAKILAVPSQKVDPSLAHIAEYTDVPEALLNQIKHFFEHYKDLEANKWVKVLGWRGKDVAFSLITEAVDKAL